MTITVSAGKPWIGVILMNKNAIEELKYSIEPKQGFMECRTGIISEETIKLAIEALEKQTPQKPIRMYRDATCWKFWKCPSCGYILGYKYNYCYSCGQRLDWKGIE